MLRTPTLQTTVMVPCHASCFFFASIIFYLQTYRRCEDMKVLLRKSSERPWLYWSRRSRHSHGALWRALGRSRGKWWKPWWHGFPWRPCCWWCSRWWPCTNPWGQWVVSISPSCVCWSQLGHFFDVLQLIHAEIRRNTCTCSFSKQIKSLDEVNFSDSPFEGRLLVHDVSLGRTLMATTEGFLAKVLVRIQTDIHTYRIQYTLV